MIRAMMVLAALSWLAMEAEARADGGPVLGSPENPATDTSSSETVAPGPVATDEPAATSPTSPEVETWRYRWHEGRWWYYVPQGQWVYWDGATWHGAARIVPPRYSHDAPLDPAMIPAWPGPPPRYGPPPYPGMPRYNGEPYLIWNGRPYRVRGAYANGFMERSGPPFGEWGWNYGYGYGAMGYPR